jgi:hypothetical protein
MATPSAIPKGVDSTVSRRDVRVAAAITFGQFVWTNQTTKLKPCRVNCLRVILASQLHAPQGDHLSETGSRVTDIEDLEVNVW